MVHSGVNSMATGVGGVMPSVRELYLDLMWLMLTKGSYTVKVQKKESGVKFTIFGDPDVVYEFTFDDLDKERGWIDDSGRRAGQEGEVPAGEQVQAPDGPQSQEAGCPRSPEGDK